MVQTVQKLLLIRGRPKVGNVEKERKKLLKKINKRGALLKRRMRF